MLIGRVASPLSGASIAPTMPPVAIITVLLPPASACATASTSAFLRANRSPAAANVIWLVRASILGRVPLSEAPDARMPQLNVARLRDRVDADLAQRRALPR